MKEKAKHKAVRQQESQLEQAKMRWRQFDASYDQDSPTERAQAEGKARKLHGAIVTANYGYGYNAESKAVFDYSAAQYDRVLAAAYPPGIDEAYARLRAGDPSGIETAVAFLELDLMVLGSGYFKEDIIQALKRQNLPPHFIVRLQTVCLHLVDTRDTREFRAYCRLAHKVDSPELRQALAQREQSQNPDIRRRARWMREVMETLAYAERRHNTN